MYERCIADATVETGWTPRDWSARLRQMAAAARTVRPEVAAELVAWADAVDARRVGPPPPVTADVPIEDRSY